MKILAISGSARHDSTNTALLKALQAMAPVTMEIEVFHGIAELPVFSPDLEGPLTPHLVRSFVQKLQACDGVLIASPEYVRGIPGGLKNAIDWLVSGDEVVHKPIALVHASHRGDDMLAALRMVLSTVSSQFNADLFFRLSLMKETPDTVQAMVNAPENRPTAVSFLHAFAAFCQAGDSNAAIA